jgi:hypothetical protein
MRCLFSQIGLGIDLLLLEVVVDGFVLWIIGLVPGLIALVIKRRSGPRPRKAPVVLGAITLLTALGLWIICIWGYTKWGFSSGGVQLVTLFALANTWIAVRVLWPPRRRVAG